MKKISLALVTLALMGLAVAEGTRQWKETGYEEFERGSTRGVAIRSTGQLELAPAFKVLTTTPSTFIWRIVADREGTVYAATGAPARVYRITPDGKSSVIFEPKELQVQTVAMGKDGAIYAATSPDGKVYRIARNTAAAAKPVQPAASDYTATVFFDPKTKYIWDMAFDNDGRLYIATGDNGEIYRVEKTGQGAVFFKSDEAHIRVLAFDPKGNVIAGSDGGALIYRITPAGEGFVLYAAPRKEVTALAVDATGNIYAAATGEKRATPLGNNAPSGPVITQPGGQPVTVPFVGNVNLGGSDVFLIAADGSPRKLWSSRDDVVYALDFDTAGRLIAGTGNKGRIYAIEKNGDYADLLRASASQVTSFSRAPGGVDNPDRNWSSWTRIDLNRDARLEIPAARFVQWRAVLKPANPTTQIDDVVINYLPKNVAPVIDDITIQQGARFQAQPRTDTVMNLGAAPLVGRVDIAPTSTHDRAYIGVRWNAHDDNDDNLVFSLYYRGDNERDWKLLRSGIQDKFYSFDSGLLPDGGYTLRVVASDAPSHTPEEALSDEKQSQRFEVDNTPPRIENLAARVEGQQLHVTLHATDDASPIRRAEFSVDAGDWQYLEPVGQLSDAKTENYDFNVLLNVAPAEPQPDQKRGKQKSGGNVAVPSGEHVVVVRVFDRADNVATAKFVAR